MSVATKIPINFEISEQLDERFMKVTITLMHLGENYNGSYFSKEVVMDALPTLANTPILGYLEPNSQGQDDFADHRVGLEKVDGEWTLKYLGSAYGVIPENNNARFEKRVASDGVEREYLVVDGLLWTKFEDATAIFNRDTIKSQSMELSPVYEGTWNDKDKLFHFAKFKFNGACTLGFDVSPAMHDANIALKFTSASINWDVFKEKVDEFNLTLHNQINNKDKGGVTTVDKDKLLKLFATSKEAVEAKGVNFTEISEEDLLAKLIKFSTEKHNDLQTKFDTANSQLTEMQEKFATVEQTANEANEKLAEVTGKFEALESEKTQLQENYTTLESEVTELREFKATKIADERATSETALFAKFEGQLTAEEVASIKANVSDLTLEQIETQLFALVGKKIASFAKGGNGNFKLPVDFNTKTGNEPAWAHLIEGN